MTNLTGATDSLGQAIDVKTADVKVITGPDLSAALVGQPQTVVLEYTDDLGRTQRFNAVVTTTATQASITAKTDQVVWPGDVKNLTAADLVHNVIDADGQAVTDLSNVTMSGVDATKAGVQTVTLTYTDAAGNRVTTTINVTVDLATLTTKDVQVVAGPTAKWDYLTSLTGATDSLGQVIDVKNARVQVVTAPDLSTALIGQPQTVTFEYTDNLGQTQRVSALVTTMKTQAAIAGRDVTVVAGPNAKWTLTDSLDGSQSLAADGSALSATDLAAVTTNITPNVQKPGTYVLTLSYVDAAGNLVTGTANVNVVASQAALQVQDSQIKVGANWQAADNLLRVVDSTGQPASIEQVTVTGTVDTTKAGIYPVTYKYTDAAGNVLERTANVTVVAEPTDPGNGGGTTDPGNGGGTTDPGNGGGTTDPGNGGGTTDPGNGGGTTDPDNGGGVAAPDNGDTIRTQPEPVTPEPVADSSPVATPQPTVKKTTIQADQVRPATAALRSVAAAKTPQSSGLPQTDERRTGMTTMVAGLLGLTGLFSAWGVTKRRQRK
ncbi:DUF5011 domain-containing protein [Lactiplantibacillus garii]|uniref:DUF5011 domain-containing protein n=1 Tax=Lactiplantibacillus garii TaxID=2306423 RepID=A0A426D6M8_9LACO|nr:bacterial Ig-like domain-containing protein [Lactiplantibacillus garii]RRK10307.1 DUF5011 domain-containing protein [Lactiplantibacillus garii]